MTTQQLFMLIYIMAGVLTTGLIIFIVIRARVTIAENREVYERERLAKENSTAQAAESIATGKPSTAGEREPSDGNRERSPASTTTTPSATVPSTPVTFLDPNLSGARSGFWGRIKTALTGKVDADHRDEIEEVLYTSDLGPKTVETLMASMQEKVGRFQLDDLTRIKDALKTEILEILEATGSKALDFSFQNSAESPGNELKVWLVVGVNGAGKTTTIGKLAHRLASEGHRVLVAAGDTFRAAAGQQLKVWSERAQVEIFHPEGVLNPSAVAFDACKKAISGGFTALIVDTAGRLHTQKNLMDELIKMKRVVDKAIPGAPHETLLILDANAGQNALVQAREFHQALNLSGIILTKMDGSAKGGVAVGVSHELGLPVKMIGIGEGMDDLRPFAARDFVEAIFHE